VRLELVLAAARAEDGLRRAEVLGVLGVAVGVGGPPVATLPGGRHQPAELATQRVAEVVDAVVLVAEQEGVRVRVRVGVGVRVRVRVRANPNPDPNPNPNPNLSRKESTLNLRGQRK